MMKLSEINFGEGSLFVGVMHTEKNGYDCTVVLDLWNKQAYYFRNDEEVASERIDWELDSYELDEHLRTADYFELSDEEQKEWDRNWEFYYEKWNEVVG